MTILTLGERRALRAVEAGDVVRVYRRNGNVFRPAGFARALWRLDKAGYIQDGPDYTEAVERTCKQILTKRGLAAAH